MQETHKLPKLQNEQVQLQQSRVLAIIVPVIKIPVSRQLFQLECVLVALRLEMKAVCILP